MCPLYRSGRAVVRAATNNEIGKRSKKPKQTIGEPHGTKQEVKVQIAVSHSLLSARLSKCRAVQITLPSDMQVIVVACSGIAYEIR